MFPRCIFFTLSLCLFVSLLLSVFLLQVVFLSLFVDVWPTSFTLLSNNKYHVSLNKSLAQKGIIVENVFLETPPRTKPNLWGTKQNNLPSPCTTGWVIWAPPLEAIYHNNCNPGIHICIQNRYLCIVFDAFSAYESWSLARSVIQIAGLLNIYTYWAEI